MFGMRRRMVRRTARRTSRRVIRRNMAMQGAAQGAPQGQPQAAPQGAPQGQQQGANAGGQAIILAGEGNSPPIKLSQADAQKIQEHEGMPPEQLEDNDLKESMQELNILPLPLTPEDQAALTQH